MDLRHLRYFIAVAEERHVGRAASRLRLAQPALSRQIRDLEAELGLELLTRHPAGVDVTAAGAAVVDGARDLFANIESAVARSAHVADGSAGRLRVGLSRYHLKRPEFRRAESDIRTRYPDLDLELLDVEPGLRQWQMLRGRRLDLALGARPSLGDRALRWELLLASEVDAALVAAAHPLASRTAIDGPALAGLPLLLPKHDWNPDVLELFHGELARLGIRPRAIRTYSGPHAVIMAVAAGHGWCPVPKKIMDWWPTEGATAVRVRGMRLPYVTAAIWRADEDRPAVVRTVEILRAAYNAVQADEPIIQPHATGTRRPRLREMEVRHLRAIVALGDERSLGRASRRLRISQTAVARQLGELERIVDTPLLVRGRNGSALTPAGASLAEDAARLVTELGKVARTAGHRRKGSPAGPCVVGAIAASAAGEVLGKVLRICRERYQGIKVLVEDVPGAHQTRAIHEGRVDIGLGYPLWREAPPDLEVETITRDVIDSAILAASHPLAARRALDAHELEGEPFLFVHRRYHPQFYDRIMDALARLGLAPTVDSTYNGLQMILRMAAERRGWALGFATHRAHPPLGTVAVPIAGLSIPWGLCMQRRRDEASDAVRAVAGVIRELRQGAAP